MVKKRLKIIPPTFILLSEFVLKTSTVQFTDLNLATLYRFVHGIQLFVNIGFTVTIQVCKKKQKPNHIFTF